MDNAVRANVQDIAAHLKKTGPILSERVKAGRLKIIGGVLSLNSGKVDILAEETK